METFFSIISYENHSRALILPTRDGNVRYAKTRASVKAALILPTRDGNSLGPVATIDAVRLWSYLQGMETVVPTDKRFGINCALILPTRDGNVGFFWYCCEVSVALILPTRDGNVADAGAWREDRILLWSYLQGMETYLVVNRRF